MNICPKCQAPCNPEDTDCKICGIIFTKYQKMQEERARQRAELMTTCRACQREISKNAISCPHCGEPALVKEDVTPHKKKFRNELTKSEQRKILIGALLFIVFFFYFALKEENIASNQDSDLSTMAFIQCKDFVKQRLTAPSTADFPFMEFDANSAPDNLYIIRSYVDAQNGFGATVRTNWRCKAKYIGGDRANPNSWTLVDLQTFK